MASFTLINDFDRNESVTITPVVEEKGKRLKYDLTFSAEDIEKMYSRVIFERRHSFARLFANILTQSEFDSHQHIAEEIDTLSENDPVVRLNPSALKLIETRLSHDEESRNTVRKALGLPALDDLDLECPDCGSAVDEAGEAIGEQENCGWSHPDDCNTCGAVICDLSC